MRFFHRTSEGMAIRILASGFEDTDYPQHNATGVWLSDVPAADVFIEGTRGDVLLVVDLDANELELTDFEYFDPSDVREPIWREWVVPAAVVNERGSVRIASQQEEEEGRAEFHRRAKHLFRQPTPPWREDASVQLSANFDEYVLLNEAAGRVMTTYPSVEGDTLTLTFDFDPPPSITDRVHVQTTMVEPGKVVVAVSIEANGALNMLDPDLPKDPG